MTVVVRTWCPTCGKASGVVARDAEGLFWREFSRFNFDATWRRVSGLSASRFNKWWDQTTVIRLDEVGRPDEVYASCRDGHALAADLSELRKVAIVGRNRNVTLRRADALS